MTRKDPFAVIIPEEADLTAPLAAATELTKLYMVSADLLEKLYNEIWIEVIKDEEGTPIRTVTHIPKDLKWLMEYMRKIGSDISSLTHDQQSKQVDSKLRVMEIFMNSDVVSKEQKEEFVAQALRNKIDIIEDAEEEKELPIKDKGWEY